MSKKVWAIVLITFVNTLGYTLLVPVFPFIVDHFGGSVLTLGFLIAAYPLFQFFAAPFLGALSDRYGRRPILIVSHAGTLVAWLIFILAFMVPNSRIWFISIPLLIMAISRAFDGITGGSSPVTNAYIVDSTHNSLRTRAFGLLGAAVGVGFVMGPLFGSLLSSTKMGYVGVAVFALLLSIGTLIYVIAFLPESLPKEKRIAVVHINIWHELNIVKRMIDIQTVPGIKKLFFIRLFTAISFAGFSAIIVVFVKNMYGVSANGLAVLFLIMGVAYVINQTIVLKFVTERAGELRAFYMGILLMIISLLFLPFTGSIKTALAVILVTNLGLSLSFPTFKTLITNLVDSSKQGELNGLDESILAVANAIGPLLAGILYMYGSEASFIIFALLLAIPHIIIYIKTGRLTVRV